MYDDEQEPTVTLPETLIFVNSSTGEETKVDSNDFGVIGSSSNSVTFSGDVSGHGTVTVVVTPEYGYIIDPPADAYVTDSESGQAVLHEDSVAEISIILPEDLDDIEDDEY